MIPLRLTIPINVMNPIQCANESVVVLAQARGQSQNGIHAKAFQSGGFRISKNTTEPKAASGRFTNKT